MTRIPFDDTLLILVDFQEKLMPAIEDQAAVLENASRLVDAAGILSVPLLVTEQYPRGLGHTVQGLDISAARVVEKMDFDSCRNTDVRQFLQGSYPNIVVAGCETHVCVLQTVLGLLEMEKCVFVVEDATGSRKLANKRAGIERMATSGATIVTTEMVLFEWLGSANHPHFKAIISLIK